MQGLSTKLRRLKIVISREEIADIYTSVSRYTGLDESILDIVFEFSGKEHGCTDMSTSNFCNTSLDGWNLCESTFEGCNLEQSQLYQCLLEECNFNKSTMHSIILFACKLKFSVWKQARMHNAWLRWLDLRTVAGDFLDWSNSRLRGINLSRVKWNKLINVGVCMEESDLHKAQLEESNWNEADILNCNMHRINLRGATLIQAELANVDLSKANLEGVDFTNAVLINVNLSDANLKGACLEGANLTDVTLKRANLEDAEYDKTRWKRVKR